ncbi:hypothetical protein GCM10010275_36780 [Streptomyces litmocidini]|nr:hypothetical protein GCM10010275_36780 [Streptomyces litmocidini]
MELLVALAPALTGAVRTASTTARPILDGTLLPLNRVTTNQPFHSDRHKNHGRDVRAIARPPSVDCRGSPARTDGGVHDPFGPAAVQGTNRLCSMASDDPDPV